MDDQTDLHRLADALIANGRDLEAELEWLAQLLQRRLVEYFAEPSKSPALPGPDTPPPALDDAGDSESAEQPGSRSRETERESRCSLFMGPRFLLGSEIRRPARATAGCSQLRQASPMGCSL